jgi:hypothetical protein
LNLEAFTNITSCLPFNVLIKLSASGSSNGYMLSTSVGPEVDAALRAAVVNSTLYLGSNRKFETTDAIRVTISLPADKLQAVENKAMGSIIINPGGCAGWQVPMHGLIAVVAAAAAQQQLKQLLKQHLPACSRYGRRGYSCWLHRTARNSGSAWTRSGVRLAAIDRVAAQCAQHSCMHGGLRTAADVLALNAAVHNML